jgi:ribosomal-protein-alanine N-acetyltransferase
VTPAELAALHAETFITPRPWTEAEFTAILAGRGSFLVAEPGGFVLGRVIADEAELLTLAVAATARRQGMATRLLAAFVTEAVKRSAITAFLEVAADNDPALALYRGHGWQESGRRKGYYRHEYTATDALILTRPLAPD